MAKQRCVSVGGKVVGLSKSRFGCDMKGHNDYICGTKGAVTRCSAGTIKVSAKKRRASKADKKILAKLNGSSVKVPRLGLAGVGKIAPTLVKTCPDPAARSIQFSIVSRSGFNGRVRITGKIKNIGSAYVSNPNQQAIHLFEVPLGGSARQVAVKNFHNLNPGQEATVSWERNWRSSSPAEGEFPPNYKMNIIYDPDIRLDSNPKNDDCGNNNTKTVSGAGINALFR